MYVLMSRGFIAYDLAAVDSNHKIIPGLNWYFKVLIPQNLKAKGSMTISRGLGRAIRIKPGYEAIESSEHIGKSFGAGATGVTVTKSRYL